MMPKNDKTAPRVVDGASGTAWSDDQKRARPSCEPRPGDDGVCTIPGCEYPLGNRPCIGQGNG